MPYGNKSENDSTRPLVQGVNSYPGGSKNYTLISPHGIPVDGALNYNRSGTNRNSPSSALPGLPGTFELVAVQVPKGPRLSYKVWSKRLNKYVWARKPITIYRLKRKRSAVKSKNTLLPNKLNFQSHRVSYFGAGSVTGVSSDPTYSRTYSGDLWANFVPIGSYTAIGPNHQTYLTGGISSRFTSLVNECSDEALRRLYEAVKNQKVNIAQALAERAQTASLISDAVSRVVKAYKAIRRGNLASAAKSVFPTNSKQLANDHLLIQYGVLPLASDIGGAIGLLYDEPRFSYDVKVGKRIPLPRTLLEAEKTNSGFPHDTKVWSEGFVQVTYKARVSVTARFGRHMTEVGFTNLPALGWELMPYSFLIDWLLPIGDYLSNQDAFSDLKVEWCTKTVFIKEFVTFERQIGGRAGSYLYGNSTAGFVNEKVICTRDFVTDIPSMPLPAFKDPVSPMHIANALALLRQLKK